MDSSTLISSQELVEDFVRQVLINGKLSTAESFLAKDISINPISGPSAKGIENALKAFKTWNDAFEIRENTLLVSATSENKVINHWQINALHKGEFCQVKPTHKQINFSGVSIYEVVDSKITAIFGYSNFLQRVSL